MVYGGGSLISTQDGSPTHVYVDYWGWPGDPAGEQARLGALLSSIGGSAWLNSVTQYYVPGRTDQFGDAVAPFYISNNTGMVSGTFSDATTSPSWAVDTVSAYNAFNTQIAGEALAMEGRFGDPSGVYFIALPSQHWSFSNLGSCAYHEATVTSSGAEIAYVVLPYIPDAGALCGSGAINGSSGVLDGVSIVAGHEFAEALTDPVPYSGYASHGWEIGDVCAWQGLANVPLSGEMFPMQPLWSNAATSCEMTYP